MQKRIKKIVGLGVLSFVLLMITACQQLDVIGNDSVDSLERVFDAVPNLVDENKAEDTWSLQAPDESVRFIWSQDFSKTQYDAFLEVTIKPFMEAGMNINLLPKEMIHNDKIIVGIDFGDDALTYDLDITPIASYKQIVTLKREHIGHHASLDHFGIDLGNGNKFEWAKDMRTNDKDIVFVLDPEIFIKAGVDPKNIEGWVYAPIETMDDDGKEIEVYKLLKPFQIQ